MLESIAQQWGKGPNPREKIQRQSSSNFNSRNRHSKDVTRQRVLVARKKKREKETAKRWVYGTKEQFLTRIRELASDDRCISGSEVNLIELFGKNLVRSEAENLDAKKLDSFISYSNRESDARKKENDGQIQMHIINNSATQPVSDEVLAWLIGLRNVISERLEKMDRSFITKLVFDPRHKNLVIIEKGEVVGGICFRMFPMQKFSEIAFIAVNANKSPMGYGTHMMNHLKDFHIKHKIYILLTYAADKAVTFFEKLGFKLTVEESMYKNYIISCHGAQLMECMLEPKIVYTTFSEVVRRQKMILAKLVEDLTPLLATKSNKSTKSTKSSK